MSSTVTQFNVVCAAAVGVAAFVGIAGASRLLFAPNTDTDEEDVESLDSNSPTLRARFTAIQSAVSPEKSLGNRGLGGKDEDEGQGLLNLLYNVAEDQARREGYIHRGITCNACQASPLCGIRYKCSSCIDYDICERCEAQDSHNKTHVFLRIKIPIPPLANPRTPCIKPLYPGKKDHQIKVTWDKTQKLKNVSHFDQVEIDALVDQFETLATEDAGITREVFNQCLGPLGQQRNLVMDQMFKFYDKNRDGIIDLEEFVIALSILVKGSQQEKTPHAFKGYDVGNKGYITRENLRHMFKAYFDISLELVRDVVRSCEEEMMITFDDSADKPVSSVFNAPIPSQPASATGSSTKPDMTFNNPGCSGRGENGTWPVMEAMSQDAIDEMVENVFLKADLDKDDKITFEEFQTWAAIDNTILAWFEALGTVF